ncbi:MAG: hypothetical protein GEU80_01260 [Dehalococcoidia bacterium]|nr:hypothetical protein [Dehalococcoidia bacterium]
MNITGIDRIGMAVPELDPQLDVLEGLFGFQREQAWEDSADGTRRALLRIPGDSGIRWEVAAPLSDASALDAFIEGPRGPGLQSITIQVADLDAAAEHVRAAGAEPASEGDSVVVGPEVGGRGFTFRFVEASGAASAAASGPTGAPSLGITRVDHICHAYSSRDELAAWFGRLLGMREIWRTPDGEHEDFADLVLEWPGAPMLWEVIQPEGDESFIERFIEKRGPSVHHIAFEVADFDRATAACEHHGVPTFDEHDDETDGIRWRDAFIHPRHTGGVLTQFYWEAQAATWIRSDKVRPASFQAAR